ncbi:MAG TPA: 3-methyl-2-oxobutanoate hydroxymethyltransferase [Myxococcota bacterium]|nr:3-methyl-2-oxobutanoate hydroxymethyltransferase [Myxococcota bacterium]
MRNLTAQSFKSMKGQGKLVVLTCYDATFASLISKTSIDAILVGDSLGNVIQGRSDTLEVTLDDVIYHTRCVRRGAGQDAHIIADMPFMTFQVSTQEAMRNAGMLLSVGRANAVKLEGGVRVAETISRLVQAGIPVMGHVGLTPQSFNEMGGFKIQGRDAGAAAAILEDAVAVAEAGAYSIVLEGIPASLAARITETVGIPTIGIGASANCDGQVLVLYDMLGMNPDFNPRFLKKYADLASVIRGAVDTFGDEVRGGAFPGPQHSFSGEGLYSSATAGSSGAVDARKGGGES